MAWRGGSKEYPQATFEQKYDKISEYLSENFQVFAGEIFNIFKYACFGNGTVGSGQFPSASAASW